MIHTHDPYPFRGYDPYLRSIPMIHTWVTASVGDVLVLFLNCICRILKFVLPHVFWGWGPICLASAYLPRICRLTGGQWKTCAMSLAAWPVGPPIPFQLGLALGRVNIWCSTTVSSVVLIHRTIPYHYSLEPGCQKNKQAAYFCKLGSISFHTPFHTRSMPEPCHVKLIPIPESFQNMYEWYCYIESFILP